MVSTSSSPLLRSSSPQLRISGKRSSPSPSSLRLRLPRIVAAAAAASFASAEKTGYVCRFPSGLASSCDTLYDVLGIPMGASGEEIKMAYRRLARIFHPDVVAVDRKDSSADEFRKIHAAYSPYRIRRSAQTTTAIFSGGTAVSVHILESQILRRRRCFPAILAGIGKRISVGSSK